MAYNTGNAVPHSSLTGLLRCAGALAVFGLAAFLLHAGTGAEGMALDAFFDHWVVNGLALGAAAACVLRGLTGQEERAAWMLMGLGIALWSGGSLWYYLVLADLETIPVPSVADALWICCYPAIYAALVLLVRSRMPGYDRSLWMAGAIGALALAAVATTLFLAPLMQAAEGSFAVVVTGLAYVAVDLILLTLVATVFALSGWRLGRGWVLVGAGLALLAVADFLYLLQTAKGTYVQGGMFDAMWPAAFVLIGFAAWHPAIKQGGRAARSVLPALAPALGAITAVGLLTYDHFALIPTIGMALASITLIVATVRLFLAFLENRDLLQTAEDQAFRDPLTGLGNRRLLMRNLDRAIAQALPDSPLAVMLFDLNGFKHYNDTYGHPAGDQLLMRLGSRLEQAALQHEGSAYRLGGDEFCALLPHGDEDIQTRAAQLAASLSENGEGFFVDSSHGLALVPTEASDVESALALADRRMYAQKGAGLFSASRQTRDVLMKTLFERQPGLHTHVSDVAALAVRVARGMGMTPHETDDVAQAAELHDVGKMAIPDAILAKPGALNEEEWAFMQRHTIIGERILGAAPALASVARLVRSTHERFDGTGYPDRLAGSAIPLGARIVFVCDAFDAMTSERSYCKTWSPEDAMVELRSCAGSQFDPAVVEVLCESLAEAGGRVPPPAPSLAGVA